jgi:hypothetical protein
MNNNNIIITVSILMISFFMSGCNQDDIDSSFDKKDERFNMLKNKYEFESVKVKLKHGDISAEKIYSIEEFEYILAQLDKLKGKTIPIERIKSTDIPRLRSGSESGGGYTQAAISGYNEELTATVFLDLINKTVTNSVVSFRFPSSLYLTYDHDGGSCTSGDIVNFNAYGTVKLFVAIHGVVINTVRVTMSGYFNTINGTGELTYF